MLRKWMGQFLQDDKHFLKYVKPIKENKISLIFQEAQDPKKGLRLNWL